MRRKPALLAAAAVTAILLQAGPALAQGEAPAAEEATGPAPGEIIVTARKRQESILNVPVVAAVLGSEQLERAQITDIAGITTKVPGLFIGSSVLAVGSQISLRGVGTSALDAGIDQSVSLNIDGLQFSQGLAFKSGLFDLAQAEVLKGPQALFFGKNSPGGVIALTTADPGSEFELIARTSYEFEADEKRGELILSGPVSDTVGLRFAGSMSDMKGYFRNTAVAIPGTGARNPRFRRGNSNENYIFRGTLLWKPTTDTSVRLKVNVTRDHSDSPTSLQNVSCPNGTGPSVLGFQFIGGNPPCRQDDKYELVDLDPAAFPGTMRDGSPGLRNNGTPFTTIRQKFGTLEINHAFGAIQLTSTTGYYRNVTDTMQNGVMTAAAGPTLFADNHFIRRDWTQEIRLESDYADSPVNWLLGGYYQDGRMTNDLYIGGNVLYGLPGTLTAGTHEVDITSTSLFGQLRWEALEELEIAGGARWTHEKRSNVATTRNPLTGNYDPAAIVNPQISSKNWSPELTVTWTPTADFTVFGALKQGYKSGSYSITTPATPGRDNSFGDEKVQGGEIGIKTRLMDRSLSFNAAFYYYRFKGLQVGVSQPAGLDGVPILRTLNAGSSRTYGIDADLTYRPPSIEGLSFNLSVLWNRAKFLKLENVPCYGGQTVALGCDFFFDPGATSPLLPGVTGLYTGSDASGESLEKAPQWQILGGFDYELPVSDRVNLVFGASAQHSSRYRTVIGDRDDYFQRAFTKLNAYLTLKDSEDKWDISLIGNNLNDVIRASYCANSDFQNTTVFTRFAQVTGYTVNPTGKTDDVACAVDPGRQVFVRLTVRPMGLFQ